MKKQSGTDRCVAALTAAKRRAGSAETEDDLTAQERQIAELARDGLSNPQIGARLFLSRRSIEWHLRQVYAKLGIRLDANCEPPSRQSSARRS
jgi:DNA-binding CsgD family transcriptional regulator